MHFINTVCQLAKDAEPNLFVLTRQRKYFNKAAILAFSLFLTFFFFCLFSCLSRCQVKSDKFGSISVPQECFHKIGAPQI